MSRYLIDTDILISFSKGREPEYSRVVGLLGGTDDVGVCAVNYAEFFAGLPPSDHSYWLGLFTSLSYWPISRQTAARAGEFRYTYARAGRILSTPDTLVAAVAEAEGAILLTANATHYPMPSVTVQVIGP